MVERVAPAPIDAEALKDARAAAPTELTVQAIAETFRTSGRLWYPLGGTLIVRLYLAGRRLPDQR